MEVVKDLNRSILDRKVWKLDKKIAKPIESTQPKKEPKELPKTEKLDPRDSDDEMIE